jgi:hypothetical protein
MDPLCDSVYCFIALELSTLQARELALVSNTQPSLPAPAAVTSPDLLAALDEAINVFEDAGGASEAMGEGDAHELQRHAATLRAHRDTLVPPPPDKP